ncbi:molybdenum cofactor biosynthesis protein B [Bacterioplanoides sp.]|uniref:molybdenum cofactor biosynthesis protein B n=1 Tax=Bacterioplanoides sp. TaxID=2066072 RepID=UPI003B002B88
MAKTFTDDFIALNIAVLTVSDSRTEDTDTSGKLLVESLQAEGHSLCDKKIVIDDVYKIRAQIANWIADETTQAILVTGGTGFTGRDSTPEAVTPLFDKTIDGFGELFRQISFQQIGTSTVQSRAIAGLSNGTVIFCMPGSTNACRTAWDEIIKTQLNSTHRPCNFVPQLKQVSTAECESRG